MAETASAPRVADLARLLSTLRQTPAMRAKQRIQHPAAALAPEAASLSGLDRYALPGDDAAAIRCGDLYQLLAIEGMLPGFVDGAPWFAGWSAVMANVSDIAAMGGRATAVVNAYWHHDEAAAAQLLAGIRAACNVYGLVLAGGHTSHDRSNAAGLAVAITGIARRLLSTLHVAPGQVLAMAVDLEGQWHPGTAYWKAFQGKSSQRLRAQLEVLPRLAEAGLLKAAKDISNAGLLGTLLMLLETSGCGAVIGLDQLPAPDDGDTERWLQAFPSYGFVFALDEVDLAKVAAAFAFEGLTCARIGRVTDDARLMVGAGSQYLEFWNLRRQAFTGFGAPICASHPED